MFIKNRLAEALRSPRSLLINKLMLNTCIALFGFLSLPFMLDGQQLLFRSSYINTSFDEINVDFWEVTGVNTSDVFMNPDDWSATAQETEDLPNYFSGVGEYEIEFEHRNDIGGVISLFVAIWKLYKIMTL